MDTKHTNNNINNNSQRNWNNKTTTILGIRMVKAYNNSPLVEAVCQIEFSDDTEWDEKIPDRLYDRIKGDFPNRTSRIKTSCPGMPEGKKQDQVKINKTEYIVFSNDNKKIEISVCNKKCLLVRVLKPYPSWETFNSTIEFAIANLSEISTIKKISKSRLYYYNIIETNRETVDEYDYFKLIPKIPKGLPQTMSDFIIGCEFPFTENNAICKTVITTTQKDQKNDQKNVQFSFSLDYSSTRSNNLTTDNIIEWIQTAHNTIMDIFENSITTKLKNIIIK